MGTTKLLTVDELLKMSEDDYMDERQLAFFKNRLQTMEAELRANADQTTVNLRETTVVPDPADRATIEEEHALELRTRDRERKLLKKVQAAIKRIDDGEYGYCEETGDPIGVARLQFSHTFRFFDTRQFYHDTSHFVFQALDVRLNHTKAVDTGTKYVE